MKPYVRFYGIVALYNKLRLQVWPDGLVQCERPSPKADASSASVQAARSLTTITADPFHNGLNLQKVLATHSPDSKSLEADYGTALTRLSAQEKEQKISDVDPARVCNLDKKAHTLLQEAVMFGYNRFKPKLEANAAAARSIQSWLRQTNVIDSDTWQKLFQAKPPLGTLRRLRARFSVQVHDGGDFNYASLKEFTKELKRIKKWYSQPRRQWRYKKGILRKVKGDPETHCKRKAVNKKVALHIRRTLRPLGLEGLWHWRSIAISARRTLLPIHTGTVAVERFWSIFAAMIPRAVTNFTERYYEVISMLAFLRFNRAHFGTWCREGWVERDPLLMQQLPILQNALAALQHDPAEEGHLQPLYKIFYQYLSNHADIPE